LHSLISFVLDSRHADLGGLQKKLRHREYNISAGRREGIPKTTLFLFSPLRLGKSFRQTFGGGSSIMVVAAAWYTFILSCTLHPLSLYGDLFRLRALSQPVTCINIFTADISRVLTKHDDCASLQQKQQQQSADFFISRKPTP
jgi:hypothetical protein